MDLDIKQKARFTFLPKLIRIAKEERDEIADMVEIGKSLGFDRDQTEKIEKFLISDKLVSPSQHGEIISIERTGKAVAYSSLGRVVSEIRNETIFTVFNNQKLKSALEKWAADHACQITVGECSPDIIAIFNFVSVIDRTLLGKEAWDSYLEYRKFDDTAPDYVPLFKLCIIVDSIRNNMSLPEFDFVLFCDLRNRHSIQMMLKSIGIAKEIVDNG